MEFCNLDSDLVSSFLYSKRIQKGELPKSLRIRYLFKYKQQINETKKNECFFNTKQEYVFHKTKVWITYLFFVHISHLWRSRRFLKY